MLRSEARVATAMAPQYLFKLAKHFAKKVAVEQAAERAQVDFGFGHCEMQADAEHLGFHCRAEDAEALLRVQSVLESHLALMTRREPLVCAWRVLPV